MLPSEKLLFTRAEAAGMLSISVSTLDVAVARGMIRARRNGSRVTIEKREIEKFSRADHSRIWAGPGNRGSSVAGRDCFDCDKDGRKTPAARFFCGMALCQECFELRSAKSPKKQLRLFSKSSKAVAGAA
jgi:excisionase family DNA binding protein